jgi:2-hydroxychromene-2-carboxylate isomerase
MELANRVAILAAKEGWCADYAVTTYKSWFQSGLEPGSEPNLSDSLREVGRDPYRVVVEANGDEIVAALLAANDVARSLGIFGSPSFVVGSEVFWGDDRLDDALRWCQSGSLKPTA